MLTNVVEHDYLFIFGILDLSKVCYRSVLFSDIEKEVYHLIVDVLSDTPDEGEPDPQLAPFMKKLKCSYKTVSSFQDFN